MRPTGKKFVTTDLENKRGVRTPLVIAAVVLLHSAAVGTFLFMQGCSTTTPKPVVVEPPAPPVMPPHSQPAAARPHQPVFQPPRPTAPAPAVTATGNTETYVVQKGESLSKIAARAGISWRQLAEINNITDPNKVRAGQKLLIPSGAGMGTTAHKPAASAPKSAAISSGSDYTIQAGDSLSKIAKKFGVRTSELAAANKIANPNRIRVGQKLVIPGRGAAPSPASSTRTESLLTESHSAPAAAAPSAPVTIEEVPAPAGGSASLASDDKPIEYTVLTGDTLEDIAKLFIVSREDIMKLNDLSGAGDIQPGTKLLIPPPDL